MYDYILQEYGDDLIKYFTLLRYTGGSHAIEPYRFLIAGFLDEILRSGMASFITEDDYKSIDNLLNCMMGVCLMPFHKWQTSMGTNERDLDEGVPIATESRTYILAPESFTSVYRTE